MEIDPHTVQQILTKVRDQLRCPQCRKRVEADLESLKVLGDSFAVLQLKCCTCDAFIMLHATLSAQNSEMVSITSENKEIISDTECSQNASTKLIMNSEDLQSLQKSLEDANGSFSEMFDTP